MGSDGILHDQDWEYNVLQPLSYIRPGLFKFVSRENFKLGYVENFREEIFKKKKKSQIQ